MAQTIELSSQSATSYCLSQPISIAWINNYQLCITNEEDDYYYVEKACEKGGEGVYTNHTRRNNTIKVKKESIIYKTAYSKHTASYTGNNIKIYNIASEQSKNKISRRMKRKMKGTTLLSHLQTKIKKLRSWSTLRLNEEKECESLAN